MEIRQFRDGLLIYEPWYGRIMGCLGALERYLNLPATVTIENMALSDILGEVVIRAVELGLKITIPMFSLAWLLSMKVAGKIYRGVREQAEVTVGVSASVEANVIP